MVIGLLAFFEAVPETGGVLSVGAPPAVLVAVGEAPAPSGIDVDELAAMTAVCSLLMNLDETVTRE